MTEFERPKNLFDLVIVGTEGVNEDGEIDTYEKFYLIRETQRLVVSFNPNRRYLRVIASGDAGDDVHIVFNRADLVSADEFGIRYAGLVIGADGLVRDSYVILTRDDFWNDYVLGD